jgi:hypothetical protein
MSLHAKRNHVELKVRCEELGAVLKINITQKEAGGNDVLPPVAFRTPVMVCFVPT